MGEGVGEGTVYGVVEEGSKDEVGEGGGQDAINAAVEYIAEPDVSDSAEVVPLVGRRGINNESLGVVLGKGDVGEDTADNIK